MTVVGPMEQVSIVRSNVIEEEMSIVVILIPVIIINYYCCCWVACVHLC
jgi:hypothetical protein